jgi:hypothetical protein
MLMLLFLSSVGLLVTFWLVVTWLSAGGVDAAQPVDSRLPALQSRPFTSLAPVKPLK